MANSKYPNRRRERDRNSEVLSDRIPPQAVDVERSVLGSMMIDSAAVAQAMEMLNESCFYSQGHQNMFLAMAKLFEAGTPVDIVTLAEELRKNEWIEEVGGEAYLSELVENVATSANVEYHAKILREKATLRGMITAAAEITTECFSTELEPQQILDSAEARIFSISESRIKNSFQSMNDLLHTTFKEIELYAKEGGVQGIRTGFGTLDELTSGLQKGDLIIIAGRPSMGKTAFALSLTLNAVLRVPNPLPCAIFSLEMSKSQLVQRMLCSEARVNMHALRSGKLPKRDYPRLSQAAGPLSSAPIFIDDTPGISVLELRAKVRRLKAQQKGLGVIIVDYLQLMSAGGKFDNRQQEITHISRSLKGVAKELECPVIALSQLSRAVEQRTGDHKPQLSDLRESGAIEQDADVVMFVYRESRYTEDQAARGKAEIIIGKQRNGPIGSAPIAFIEDYARFDNLSTIPMEENGF